MASPPRDAVSDVHADCVTDRAHEPSKFPDLIIAGVHKAGTTSLYSYLAKHPQICPSFTKEIGFFYPLLHGRSLPDVGEYARHFGHCGNQRFRMEASPSYLYGRETIAESIKSIAADAHIIVILRDPTERLISYFSRAVADSLIPEGVGFPEYVSLSVQKQASSEHNVFARGFREGIYVDYLKSWDRVFRGHLKIVFFDDLRSRPIELVAEIVTWLGLDTSCLEGLDFTMENRTVQYRRKRLHRYVKKLYMKHEAFWRRNQALKQHLRRLYNLFNAEPGKALSATADGEVARLRELYAPHNRKLREFLEARGCSSLPAWLH